jgi:hypothetical protein
MERAVLQRVCAAWTAFPAHQMHYGAVVVRAEPQKGKQKDISLLCPRALEVPGPCMHWWCPSTASHASA